MDSRCRQHQGLGIQRDGNYSLASDLDQLSLQETEKDRYWFWESDSHQHLDEDKTRN